MKKGQVVHYQEILEKGDISSLGSVKKRGLWEHLNADEKLRLASLFLKAGEQKIDQKESGDELCEYCFSAEELSCQSTEVLFHIAAILYRFGVTHQEKRFLMLSLGKLIQIEESNPYFFETAFQGSHLWGNLLGALSNYMNDESFLAKATLKFERALEILEKQAKESSFRVEVYWDLAEALVKLGRKSGEPSDIKRGINYFHKAASLGCNQLHFLIDFGEAYVFYGLAIGDVAFLKEGAPYFKKVIAIADMAQNNFQAAYARAWFLHAVTAKNIWEMTHEMRDFDEADAIFQEAIVSYPEGAAYLWLQWGDLFLRCGWYQKDPFLIDKSLEKLTSTKLNEYEDPIAVSAILAEALAMLGMCLDDYRLILEAKNRLKLLLPDVKKNPNVCAAAAVVNFASGTHFGDESYYLHAYKHFEKAIHLDPQSIHLRYMQSECVVALSELKKTASWLRKGIKILERLTLIRKDVPLFWSELGIILLKFYPHDKKASLALETAIDKFKISMGKKGLVSDVKTVFHYGIALDLLGTRMQDRNMVQEGIDILNFVHERMPQSLNVRYQLGFAYLHFGELLQNDEHLSRAIQLFESVIKHDPEDDASLCGLGIAHLTLSELLWEEEKKLKRKSEEALLKACKFGNLDASYYLACLYSLNNECEKSLEFIKRTLQKDKTLKLEELEEDVWLSNLMQFEGFVKFRDERSHDGK